MKRWESWIVIAITVVGWAFGGGVMYAHLLDTRDRLNRLEQKVDYMILNQGVK